MRKILLVTILTALSMQAFAATAYWTGQQKQVQTVTYQWAWNCEYRYGGQTFWKVYSGTCPSSIEIQ